MTIADPSDAASLARSAVSASWSSHGLRARRAHGGPPRRRWCRRAARCPSRGCCHAEPAPHSATSCRAEREVLDVDVRLVDDVVGPTAEVRRLEVEHPPGAGLRGGTAGCAGVEPGRVGTPRTSVLSTSSATRRAMRRFVFARRESLMTPLGRWVAMTRWRPSDRPRWATSMTPSMNSGISDASAANSSMTMTSAAERPGHRAVRASRGPSRRAR